MTRAAAVYAHDASRFENGITIIRNNSGRSPGTIDAAFFDNNDSFIHEYFNFNYLRASGSGRQPQRRMARLQMSGHYAYPAVRSDVTPAPHFCPRATAAGSLH